MYILDKKINIHGLRYPKIINFNSKVFLLGSRKYKQEGVITKYSIYLSELDNNLNLIEKSSKFLKINGLNYLNNINISCWLRDIYIKNSKIYLLIELKENKNNKTFFHNNILITTTNFNTFKIEKEYKNHDFLFKEYETNNVNYLFTSKIETDKKNPNYFWGKYLFNIIQNNKEIIIPKFDNIVNYQHDKGHLLHNFYKKDNNYEILFSIRHKSNIHECGFIYKIYFSETKDLINYYNTREVCVDFDSFHYKWISYPHKFSFNNNDYIICNGDNFGKTETPIILKKYSLENYICLKYNITLNEKLKFTETKKYIYYEELVKKSGKRYNNISDKTNINKTHSPYAPSCFKLYDLLKSLNITNNDSILDIGSGRGYALSIFNLFPFKKITGVEISKEDFYLCEKNIKMLNITNIKLINDNIINFYDFNNFNYIYLYNPFSIEIFKKCLKKINHTCYIIFKNIHEDYVKILNEHNFNLYNEYIGCERNYYIFTNLNI